ncbi:MAG: alpha/beta fold hydrolase [Chitinophagaceae bacterium]|nr:alpha/beta fold hydrolase [Chitinophagaceae bacterium]
MKMKLAQRVVIAYYRTKLHTIGMVSTRKAAELAYTIFCTPRKARKKLKTPPLFHKAENLTTESDATILRGFRWQAKNPNQKKILILHGFSSYSYKFEKYVTIFLKQGFEVIAFDAPAHGLSEGKYINAFIYRDAILSIENEFGPFYGIMGHSLGGLAASLAFQKLQDQANRRLVLIAPATETETAIEHFFSIIKVDEKIKIAFREMISEITQESIKNLSVSHAVKKIQSPILWVHDRDDKICVFEDVLPVIEAKLPQIQFYITNGLGHSQVYKEADVSNTIDHFFRSGLN